jgi:hypothetical protein
MATSYEWVITKDDFGFGDYHEMDVVGTIGPRGATRSADEIAAHPEAKQFRLVGDDGEILASGYIVENNPDKCSGFEPLDDFGTPALGATVIHYLENGTWSQL